MMQNFAQDWRQIRSILIVSLHGFTLGMFFTWSSPAIPRLVYEEYEGIISLEEATYLTIIPFIAYILVSPWVWILMDAFGRRRTLFITAIPYAISWILTAIGGSIYIFYLAKIFNGISDTCTFATLPAYISEVATPQVRGLWGNSVAISIYFGNFIVNIIGSYFTIRTSALVSLVVPVSFCFLIFLLPETPYYLIMRDRTDEAREVLCWLRRKDDVEEELHQLQKDVQRQLSEKGGYKELFTIASNRKAVFIGFSLRCIQQFAGITVLSLYTQLIFLNSGISMSASTCAIIYSGLLTIFNLLCSFTLDYIGRRRAMIISGLGSGCTLFVLGTYLYLLENDIDVSSYNIIPLLSIIIYAIFFALGLGIVPTLMLGELFSSSIKGKALGLMNMGFGFLVCVNSKLFSFLLIQLGMAIPFYIFCACCFLGAICSYFIVPETRGKTLEEIQQQLKRKEKS